MTRLSQPNSLTDPYLQQLLDTPTNLEAVPEEFYVDQCKVSLELLVGVTALGIASIGIGLVFVVLSIFGSAPPSQPQPSQFPITRLGGTIIGLFFLVAGGIAIYWVILSRHDRVILSRDGIQRTLYGKHNFIAWPDLMDVRPVFRTIKQGRKSSTYLRKLVLVRSNGDQVLITGRYLGIARLEQPLYSEISMRLLPVTRNEFNEKGRVRFGRIELTVQGVRAKAEFTPWGVIKTIRIHDASILIERFDRKDPRIIGQIHDTPKHFILLTFVKQKIAGF